MRKPDQALDAAAKPHSDRAVQTAYTVAKERFAALGVDTDAAVREALDIPISVHCWQADDVRGLEVHEQALDSGGIQATGNYPGAARTADEIRRDFEQAAGVIPGVLRFNLHASYAETEGKVVDRDALEPKHFRRWIDWAKERGLGLDFNPTLFAHPMVKDGFTLSSETKRVRDFWIAHCIASRRIAAAMARELGPVVCNIWIPDGRKDSTADRWDPRKRLIKSLDQVLEVKMRGVVDAVESKLFGIGVEDYTVGSHEFYLAYAVSRRVIPCYDMGHFHPTESVADKLSATLPFTGRLLVHVSRGIRWDSDHVARFTDELKALCDEAARGRALRKIYWALDFFDASINRVGAWVIGARALRKALLHALLEPWELVKRAEYTDRGAQKLALTELRSELPFGAVWDWACLQAEVPTGISWLPAIQAYEQDVLLKR